MKRLEVMERKSGNNVAYDRRNLLGKRLKNSLRKIFFADLSKTYMLFSI